MPKEKRVNILYFSSFGTLKGGGQRSLYYLIRDLNKKIFNPIVICPEDGEFISSLKEIGVDTCVIPFKRLRKFSIKFILTIYNLYKEKNISIVHTDDPIQTFYAGIVAYISKIPLIWHIRVSEDHNNKINKVLDRALPYLCNRLILVSKALETRFHWLKSSKKLTIIHNAINLKEFDKSPPILLKDELGLTKNIILIACVGRIEEMKGQKHLAKAISKIADYLENVKILLIGEADPEYYHSFKSLLQKLNIGHLFLYLGHRKDIFSIIKGIDFLVLPSQFGEGLSRVILEAMAAYKPVITTDIGGNKEAVADGVTGFVVSHKDENALASTIKTLLENSEKRAGMGIAGRKRVEQFFTLDKNVKKIEEEYVKILISP